MESTAHRMTVFNHKGGVGKTTLTVNIAAALGELGKRVLLVDSDPQCNLTSHLLDEEIVDDLLKRSDTDNGRTIFTAVRPVLRGDGPPRLIKPFEPGITGIYLLPGDIELSTFENRLNDFWSECFKRYPTGYRGTAALSSLVSRIASRLKIDFVFYDTGPNVGPLNRVILLDCHHFIVPAACDLFSIRALKTLGLTLRSWVEDWRVIASLAPDDTYLLRGEPQLLGFIPQRFRTYGGVMTQVNSAFFTEFRKRLSLDLLTEIKAAGIPTRGVAKSQLGSVKDYATLVQLSQAQGKPLWKVDGSTAEIRRNARTDFHQIARSILQHTTRQ